MGKRTRPLFRTTRRVPPTALGVKTRRLFLNSGLYYYRPLPKPLFFQISFEPLISNGSNGGELHSFNFYASIDWPRHIYHLSYLFYCKASLVNWSQGLLFRPCGKLVIAGENRATKRCEKSQSLVIAFSKPLTEIQFATFLDHTQEKQWISRFPL